MVTYTTCIVLDDLHGVKRDVWLLPTAKLDFENFMKRNVIPVNPDMTDDVHDFKAPQNALDNFGQQLSTYLQVCKKKDST